MLFDRLQRILPKAGADVLILKTFGTEAGLSPRPGACQRSEIEDRSPREHQRTHHRCPRDPWAGRFFVRHTRFEQSLVKPASPLPAQWGTFVGNDGSRRSAPREARAWRVGVGIWGTRWCERGGC